MTRGQGGGDHGPASSVGSSDDARARSVPSDLEFLGRNIRSLRRAHSLTLEDVSARSGLSVSMLSLVERGKSTPSLPSLLAIAEALETSVSDLVDATMLSGTETLHPSDKQPTLMTESGVSYTIVVDDVDRGIQIVRHVYPPRSGARETLRHIGQYEYGLLMQGSLVVRVGATTQHMEAGDAIQFDSSLPHRIENPFDEPAVAVWVGAAGRPHR